MRSADPARELPGRALSRLRRGPRSACRPRPVAPRRLRLALRRPSWPHDRPSPGRGDRFRRALRARPTPDDRVRGRVRGRRGTIFGHHCTVGVNESVRIGDDCLIAEMVSIRDSDHVTTDPRDALQDAGSRHVAGGDRQQRLAWVQGRRHTRSAHRRQRRDRRRGGCHPRHPSELARCGYPSPRRRRA